jgi:ubiquitin-protein ligase
MFLPANYPISPPQMYFVLPTADDDGSNFNPNLHMGGNGQSTLPVSVLC